MRRLHVVAGCGHCGLIERLIERLAALLTRKVHHTIVAHPHHKVVVLQILCPVSIQKFNRVVISVVYQRLRKVVILRAV